MFSCKFDSVLLWGTPGYFLILEGMDPRFQKVCVGGGGESRYHCISTKHIIYAPISPLDRD